MTRRAFRLATLPARTAYSVAEHGVWLARAAAEVYGYGVVLHGQEDEPYSWALSNEELDRVFAGNSLDQADDLR